MNSSLKNPISNSADNLTLNFSTALEWKGTISMLKPNVTTSRSENLEKEIFEI